MDTGRSPLRPFSAVYRFLIWTANSARATVLSFVTLVTISAVLYSIFEDKGVGDAIWWAVVTASTVGYGDTYPTTSAGRVVAGTLIMSMVLLVIPLITAHFASKLIVDLDAFRHEEQEEIKANLRAVRDTVERLEAALSEPDSSSPAPADAGRSGRR